MRLADDGPAPLASAPAERLARVRVVLTDVDDTLTKGGRLAPTTLAAIARLRAAGLAVVPVTGGCAGWCDHLVRAWPVAAVIGENGGFYFELDDRRRLRREFWRPFEEIREDQRRLLTVAGEALRRWPAARLAGDQAYRLVDVAVDHGQDVGPLSRDEIRGLLACFQAAGARAQASSIHVNAWYGDHDKARMAERLLGDLGIAPEAFAEQVLVVGDAPNDEPLLARFPLSVGVANMRRHLSGMRVPPAFMTGAGHGAGFEELAARLLDARAAVG